MPTVYSPPVSTYTALATETLSGSDASITFASIPSNYRDLILIVAGNATGNENAELRFNGDSGSNYTNVRAIGTAGTHISDSATGTSTSRAARIGSGQSTVIMHIMDYSATDKHKTVLARSMQSTDAVHMGAARWANTNAIYSIQVFVSANAYALGTTISLYGIEA